MRRVLRSFLPLIAFFLLCGLGCKGAAVEPGVAAATRPLALEYWTVFNDVDILRQFAAEYSAARPYVSINIRRLGYDEFEDRFVNALADDVAPDIISVQNTAMTKYQSRLATMPSTVKVYSIQTTGSSLNKETVVTPQTFVMPTARAVQSLYVSAVGADVVGPDGVYGLPLAVDTLAVYYNKDLLDRSGVALPPQTWTELTEAVKKSTKRAPNGSLIQSGIALGRASNIDNAFDILSVLMLQSQARMVVGNQVFFAEGIDSRNASAHPALQALSFYTNFAQNGVDYQSWDATLPKAFEAFVRGQSVFYVGYAFDRTRIKAQAPQMNLEVIALPQLNPARPANIANFWVESVVKKSKHQNEAWDFVRFMTTPENTKRYVEKTGQPNPLRAGLDEQLGSATVSVFASQALFAESWYRGKNIDAARRAFFALIEGEFAPLGEREAPIERSVRNLNQAAQTVQQTM